MALRSSDTAEMKDEQHVTLQRDFAVSALRAGVRVDGRALDASRLVKIVLGPAHGQAHVSIGNTVALASATAEAVTPYSDRPSEGILGIAVELSAAASEPAALEFAVHGAHPPADRLALALRGNVERVIRDSRAVDTEALCIIAGKKVWAVSVDVSIVDADGNCIDAAHLASMAALLHARRNDVSISGTDIHIHPFSEREPLPLPVHHVPLTVTYALFAGSNDFPDDIAALDPCLAEELASDGLITVALNAHGEVCGLHKAGGLPISAKLVARCAGVGVDRVAALTEILNRSLHDSSVKHHPLSAVRPVLVAPEPTALLGKSVNGGTKSNETTSGNKSKDSKMFEGGASLWNAIPMSDTTPPMAPNMEVHNSTAMKDDTGDGAAADAVAATVFRALDGHSRGASAQDLHGGKNKKQSKVPTTTPALSGKVSSSSDSDKADSDSDEDLLAAVISKPKGGGAHRAQPRVKKHG